MTINEKKQLTNYIKGLVRESLQEIDMPRWHNELYGINDEDYDEDFEDEDYDEADEHDDFWKEMGKSQPGRHYGGPDVTSTDYDEFGSPAYSKNSLSEERLLKNHIKNLIRESIVEAIKGSDLGGVFSTDDPRAAAAVRGDTDSYDDWYGEDWRAKKGREDLSNLIDKRSRGEDAELGLESGINGDIHDQQMEKDALDNEKAESDRYSRPFGDLDDTENLWSGDPDLESDDDDEEIAGINELRRLAESYARQSVRQILSEGKKKKKGKRKNKKEKTSSKDKTVISQLNADGTNAAHYFYKLYGVENGTDAQKAAARSKGYKKAKGKKNDTGVPYKFSSKERNRLSSLLTDRG